MWDLYAPCAAGTIECVKLMQAGYPSRAPYADLQARFKTALPPFMLGLEDYQFVELLRDHNYLLGRAGRYIVQSSKYSSHAMSQLSNRR